MENPNDWTSEKDVSCMYSLSQQDTSRDNRLNMLVESRVRREVQARFGGEFLETYRRNTARHRVLSLRLTAQYLVLFVAGLLGVNDRDSALARQSALRDLGLPDS